LSNDTTLLFGLAGVRVERVVLRPGGIREVHVQTVDEGASGCPSCGVLSPFDEGRRGDGAARHPLWDRALDLLLTARIELEGELCGPLQSVDVDDVQGWRSAGERDDARDTRVASLAEPRDGWSAKACATYFET
jgi:hypothetical protein